MVPLSNEIGLTMQHQQRPMYLCGERAGAQRNEITSLIRPGNNGAVDSWANIALIEGRVALKWKR